MAYSEALAERMRKLIGNDRSMEERNMFGGLAFLLNGNMCCGVLDNYLVLRLGEERASEALKEEHTKLMDFTGKPMKSMLYVLPEGIKTDEQLQGWMQKAIDFALTLPPK